VDLEAPCTAPPLGRASDVGDEELLSAESADTSSLGASEGVATGDALLAGDESVGAAERSTLEQPASRSALKATASALGMLVIELPFIERDEHASTQCWQGEANRPRL
jgi:hypothetical protein